MVSIRSVCLVLVVVGTGWCLDEDLKSHLLELHNTARANEGASNMNELVWDQKLEDEAQEWANRCVFKHQMKERGENLAYNTAKKSEIDLSKTAFENWFNEKDDYSYGQRSCGTTGACHYTQLVWHETRRVGCGVKQCAKLRGGAADAWYLVCFYDPKGNMNGEKPYLKGKPCSKCRDDQSCKSGLCSGGSDPCEDLDNNCDMWANQMNQCSQNKKFMQQKCALACKFCKAGMKPSKGGDDNKTSGEKENTGSSDCKDDNKGCAKWASRGECERNPTYMKTSCKKSCNVCGGGTDGNEGNKNSKTQCDDKNRACKYWARQNECARNPGYMNINCRKSCHKCGEVSDCVDNHDDCGRWADYGYCDAYPSWMHAYCKLSCGQCPDEGDGSSDCKDIGYGCRGWARGGHCSRSPGYMLINCKESCNVC